MAPLLCPACRAQLTETKLAHGIFWRCDQCAGLAITLELLRRTFTAASINPLWLHAAENAGWPGRPCPQCAEPMLTVSFSGTDPPQIDICKHCHLVWFDRGEVETLQPLVSQPEPARLSPEQALAIVHANAEATEEKERARNHAAAWAHIGHFLNSPASGRRGVL